MDPEGVINLQCQHCVYPTGVSNSLLLLMPSLLLEMVVQTVQHLWGQDSHTLPACRAGAATTSTLLEVAGVLV